MTVGVERKLKSKIGAAIVVRHWIEVTPATGTRTGTVPRGGGGAARRFAKQSEQAKPITPSPTPDRIIIDQHEAERAKRWYRSRWAAAAAATVPRRTAQRALLACCGLANERSVATTRRTAASADRRWVDLTRFNI